MNTFSSYDVELNWSFLFPSQQGNQHLITWSLTGQQMPLQPVTARTPVGQRGWGWRPRWTWSCTQRTSSTMLVKERGRLCRRERDRLLPVWKTQRLPVSLTATTSQSREKVRGEVFRADLNRLYVTPAHTNHSSHSGILKNKISYPPPLTDKNMKNRLREKLSDYNSPTITSPPPNNNNTTSPAPPSVNIMTPSSRTPSLEANEGSRLGNHESGSPIKPPVAPRPQIPPGGIYRETNGGVAMHLKSGTVNGGNESDSE